MAREMPVKMMKKLIVPAAAYSGRQEPAKNPAKTSAMTGRRATASTTSCVRPKGEGWARRSRFGRAKRSVKKITAQEST
ncbi:hypothetical protein D9M72_519330 [compost metagenome]